MSPRDINRIDPIVPERDDLIGRRTGGAGASAKKPAQRPPSGESKSGGGRLLSIIALVAILLVGALGWMKFADLSTKHTNLQQRFDALESRLSSTDESVSQSGAALQLRINQQKEELDKHWAEIKKLWGVAYDTNRTNIEKNRKDIDFLAGKRTGMEKTLDDLKSRSDKDTKILANVSANYLAMQADLDNLTAKLRESLDGFTRVQTAISRIDGQLKTNSEAIASFDAYRRQVNQKIFNIEQKVPGAGTQ